MIIHAALLFYQTTGAVFSPKGIYLVCQQNLIAEGGSSTHNRFPQIFFTVRGFPSSSCAKYVLCCFDDELFLECQGLRTWCYIFPPLFYMWGISTNDWLYCIASVPISETWIPSWLCWDFWRTRIGDVDGYCSSCAFCNPIFKRNSEL